MTDAAPQALHDLLDTYWEYLVPWRRIGMGAQLIFPIDSAGKLGKPKVNLSANGDVAKKESPA